MCLLIYFEVINKVPRRGSHVFFFVLVLPTVFDEHVRRGKSSGVNSREMDFESFLDFVLALENKDTPEGLTYLFRCLDLQGRGYLTTADIHTLFRLTLFCIIIKL